MLLNFKLIYVLIASRFDGINNVQPVMITLLKVENLIFYPNFITNLSKCGDLLAMP